MNHRNLEPDTDRSQGKKATVLPHIRPQDVDRTPFGPAQSPGERSALNELNAMHAIGEALSEVPEEETRARVLAWAIRLFTENRGPRGIVSGQTQAPDATGTSSPSARTDGSRSVETLETVSVDERAHQKDVVTPSRPRHTGPLLTIRFRWRR